MKTQRTRMMGKALLIAAASGSLVCLADSASAQSATPQLSAGASQVIQLEQAKIGDDTIIGFIRGSGNDFTLDPAQIIYLRQQGVSETVISAMLSQPRPAAVAAAAPVPAAPLPPPAPVTTTVVAAPAVAVQPAVTYVQPAPVVAYPYYYPYGYYRCGLPIGVSVGWHSHGGWGVAVRL